jgi:protein SCO1
MSRARLAAVALVLAALGGAAFGLVAHLAPDSAEGGFVLPQFHGQVSWAAGERRAPPFNLRDQSGRAVSLSKMQNRPVLLTFLGSRCTEECPVAGRQLAMMLRGMEPSDRPTLLIVSVNPAGDTPSSIRHAMANWRLAGPTSWHWLRGTRSELASVRRDYGIAVEDTTNDVKHDLALYLIDRQGFQRTGYLFPFLPNFVALDLQTLARERA